MQAGTKSWSAFFFGSSDAAGSITVDKPPASLWVMEISARIFGVNSWSILVPEALMGVAAVYLLFLTVRRWAGAGAGLLAGLALAVTPVATLMFRFNNPDAMLVLLMVAAVYTTTRAVDAAARRAGTRWLMLTGALVGLAFLTKSLQALLVVPGLALLFLIVAPTSLRRRLFQLVAAGVAMLVRGLWWVVAVTLIPAADRPYIGGSQHNSVWELIWGYNGLGRLTGNETGSVGGGGGGTGTGMWGSTGLTRLFSGDIGGQIAWLMPAALMLLAAGLWFTRRAPRTDRSRGLLIVWGGWFLVTGLTFSEMQGIFHQYYTVALAPAIAALVGVGAASLWRGRRHFPAALTLAVTVAVTAIWSFVLLDRSSAWHPWLRYAVLVGGLVAAVGIAGSQLLSARLAAAVAGLAVVASLAGPAAYSVQTASVGHSGSIVTAGPAVAGSTGGPGGRGGPGGGGRRGGFGGRPAGHDRRPPDHGTADRPARARVARPGRDRQSAQRQHLERGDDQAAADRRLVVPLGGGCGRLAERLRLPAGDRLLGHADRRLQRQRPVADAGPVQGLGGRRRDPLLHRLRQRRWRRWRRVAAARAARRRSPAG